MFKKIEELLEAGKIDTETAEEIDGEVSKAIKELRDEAASYRVKYQELNRTFEEVQGSKQKLEEQLNGLDEQIKKAKEDGKAELVTELERQKSEKEELAAKLRELEESNKSFKIENAISKELSKYRVKERDFLESALKHMVVFDENDIKFKDGDNLLAIEEGIKSFLESRDTFLESQGKPGSGSNGGGTSGGDKKWDEMSATERMRLFKEDPKKYEQLKAGAK